MISDVAIHVKNLSKAYQVYDKPADLFLETITRRQRHRNFWALRNVNINVRRGEVVGVIGPNGAGKSTLLKILAGTLDRTEGQVEVNGRISAILELGTGFHEQRTGRENIFLGGMCLGMRAKEIREREAWIVDFAGIGDFIDQPFRVYSSGMKARLTFAVAVSVEPDILIVDEALAAGDMLFITKCIQRIEDICASGATVLFVSHSLAMVERFCSRVLYMDRGAVVQEGNAHEVCKAYELACLTNDSEAMQLQIKSEPPKEIGTGQVRIKDFLILDETGKGCDVLRVGQRCRFEIELESHESFSNVLVSVQFIGEDARTIFSTSSSAFLNAESQEASIEIPLEKGRQCVRVHVPHFLAGAGRYFVTVGVAPNLQKNSYTDFYDVRWKQWAVTVQREALTQNVALELPCTWETVLK